MKKIIFTLTASIFLLPAFAYKIMYGDNVVITSPVYENLYISGGTVTINAPVYGDLICAGGTVNINDTVQNDIMVVGGTVTFNGYAGDDLRCGGGQLYILKSIAGDLVIAGGRVTVNREVVIGGGLLAAGGDVLFNGVVNKSVRVGFGTLVFNGQAKKDMDCRGGNLQINGLVEGPAVLAAGKIAIGDNATFKNAVRYWSNKGEVDFKRSLQSGSAIFDRSLKMETGQWYYLGAISFLGLLWYIGMAFVMIALIQYLFNAVMKKSGDTVFNKTLRSMGYGALYFIAVPMAAVIAFITLIGVPIGLLLVFNYVITIILATVITSVVAAHWFNNRFAYQWSYWKIVFAALGIFIILKAVSLMPFLGWLIVSITVCMAFGAILQNITWKRKVQMAAEI